MGNCNSTIISKHHNTELTATNKQEKHIHMQYENKSNSSKVDLYRTEIIKEYQLLKMNKELYNNDKKLSRFVKWINMISNNSNTAINNLSILEKQLHSIHISNHDMNNSIKRTISIHQIAYPSDSKDRKGSKSSFSEKHRSQKKSNFKIMIELGNEQSDLNTKEPSYKDNDCLRKTIIKNLQSYKLQNNNKFLSRLMKGPPKSLRLLSWMVQLNIPYINNTNVSADNNYLIELRPSDNMIDKFINDIMSKIDNNNLISNVSSNVHIANQTMNNITIKSNIVYYNIKLYSSNVIYNYLQLQSISDLLDAQLKKDLHRTLTETNQFNDKTNQQQLYRLLKALAILDKDLEYCQGMNLLTGIILYVTNFNEIQAFLILVSLFSNTFGNTVNMRCLYSHGFYHLRLLQNQFSFYFKKEESKLNKHLEEIGLPTDMFLTKWYLSFFSCNFEINDCVRILDCVLVEGLDFFIKLSLTLLKHLKPQIMLLKESDQLVEYFRQLHPNYKIPKNEKIFSPKYNMEKIIQESVLLKLDESTMNKIKVKFDLENSCLDHTTNLIETNRKDSRLRYKEESIRKYEVFNNYDFIDLEYQIYNTNKKISLQYDLASNKSINNEKIVDPVNRNSSKNANILKIFESQSYSSKLSLTNSNYLLRNKKFQRKEKKGNLFKTTKCKEKIIQNLNLKCSFNDSSTETKKLTKNVPFYNESFDTFINFNHNEKKDKNSLYLNRSFDDAYIEKRKKIDYIAYDTSTINKNHNEDNLYQNTEEYTDSINDDVHINHVQSIAINHKTKFK